MSLKKNEPAEAGRDLATGFEDVELFLAEHGLNDESPSHEQHDEVWGERDAAEVLTASWKDRRAELNNSSASGNSARLVILEGLSE